MARPLVLSDAMPCAEDVQSQVMFDPIPLADELRRAESTRIPVGPPSTSHPGLTVEDAYRIQRVNLDRRIAAGETRVGHKVGLTSLAMQRQLGVDQPDFGVITDRMVIPNNGSIAVDALIAPRIEAEFAFRIATSLPPRPTLDELRAAVGGVALALEVIDSRVADWTITLVDTIADNASSARIVCGPFREATPELLAALPDIRIALHRDGAEQAAGPGSAVLGDPLVSLHWLAGAIGTFDEGFTEGDVVLAGAVAAAIPLTAGCTFSLVADDFASAVLHVTAVARPSD